MPIACCSSGGPSVHGGGSPLRFGRPQPPRRQLQPIAVQEKLISNMFTTLAQKPRHERLRQVRSQQYSKHISKYSHIYMYIHMRIYIYIYTYVHIYTYNIHIYIYRERERENISQCTHMYIHIYILICIYSIYLAYIYMYMLYICRTDMWWIYVMNIHLLIALKCIRYCLLTTLAMGCESSGCETISPAGRPSTAVKEST